MNGFLISTAMSKELKGLGEFTAAAEAALMDLKPRDNVGDSLESVTCVDFSVSLEKELANHKEQRNKTKQAFSLLEKYRSLVLLNNRTSSLPSEIVQALRRNGDLFYAIKRIIPLDFIIKIEGREIRDKERNRVPRDSETDGTKDNGKDHSTDEKEDNESIGLFGDELHSAELYPAIGDSVKEQISNYIKNNKFAGTYKILFEGRLCPTTLKEELFKIILPILTENKVKLEGPENIILVQAFKGLIGLTAMKNDRNNFNFSIYSDCI